MEGSNVPVDFSRILLHLKTLMPFGDELPLIGSQIVENDFKFRDYPGKLQFIFR